MIPNNNLSVLPFYTSIEQQNARKWWIYGKVYPLFTPAGYLLPFQLIRPHRNNTITTFRVYTKDGQLVGNYSGQISEMGITIKAFTQYGYDVIVFAGQLPIFTQMDNGQYYVQMGDGVQTWYSEIFTVVNDISGYLKLEWWDNEDFTMEAGTIVYTNPTFKNVLYLCSDIAKPEYEFSEEIIERDGYTFPVKQVSEKRYRFSFLASEYLLDVLRFVRMADYATVTKNGHLYYDIDTFLITPEWEDNGDVAVVDAEFTTGTVAKKLGVGYIQAKRGDFNDDFNDDFDIGGDTPIPPTPEETYIQLEQTTVDIGSGGAIFSARIKTNPGKVWEIASAGTGVTEIQPTSATGTGNFQSTNITVNATSSPREINVVFRVVGEPSKTATLTIRQAASVGNLTIYNHDGFNTEETISGDTTYIHPDVSASGNWIAEISVDWLGFNDALTQKTITGSSGSRMPLHIWAQPNETGSQRSTLIRAHLENEPDVIAHYEIFQNSI